MSVIWFVWLTIARRKRLTGSLAMMIMRMGRMIPPRRRRWRIFMIRMLIVILVWWRIGITRWTVGMMMLRRWSRMPPWVWHTRRLAIMPIIVGIASHGHSVGIVVTTVRGSLRRWWSRRTISHCLRFVLVIKFTPLFEAAFFGILGCGWHGLNDQNEGDGEERDVNELIWLKAKK
jgi:hypothetical protein